MPQSFTQKRLIFALTWGILSQQPRRREVCDFNARSMGPIKSQAHASFQRKSGSAFLFWAHRKDSHHEVLAVKTKLPGVASAGCAGGQQALHGVPGLWVTGSCGCRRWAQGAGPKGAAAPFLHILCLPVLLSDWPLLSFQIFCLLLFQLPFGASVDLLLQLKTHLFF